MIDIKAIKDRAESIKHLSVMVMNKHEVSALCDEIERLRVDAAAYHALRTELDKQMVGKRLLVGATQTGRRHGETRSQTMTIKHTQTRFTSDNEIPIDKAMVPAYEWRMAMAEIWVLKDQHIWDISEISQLQEQNTYLDKVSAELQDLCDRQAKRLAEVEKDAARYHFLRENSYIELFCDSPQVEGWKPEMLDASIDAAMEAK